MPLVHVFPSYFGFGLLAMCLKLLFYVCSVEKTGGPKKTHVLLSFEIVEPGFGGSRMEKKRR